MLGLTVSSHLPQKEKVAKIAQIYRERNLKLVDWLADLIAKGNAACLKSFFNFAVNLKKVSQQRLGQSVKQLRVALEEVASGPVVGSGKSTDGQALRQAISLTRAIDEGLSSLIPE